MRVWVFCCLVLAAAAALARCQAPVASRFARGGTVVLEVRRAGVPFKPYVSQLRTPGGIAILRDSPSDHLHHHGLMLAVRAADVNFWEETPGCGTQRTVRSRDLRRGVADRLEWVAPDAAAPTLCEDRQLTLAAPPDRGATLVDWCSTLALPPGQRASVRLTGAHYHGLGMRFVEAMEGGTFQTADGDPGVVFRGEERLARGRWCAYHAAVDGRDVTVAMFDHPGNPRPATWFTMPRAFGYLSATLRLHEDPLEVTRDRPVALRYGIAAWDGKVDAARIDALCRAWVRGAKGR